MSQEAGPRRWMRRSIRHLKPYYNAPRERLLRMDQNTNLIGRNPALGEALDDHALQELDLNQYPTRDADDLILAIEHHAGLPAGTVLCGNGSDEVLDIILKTFTDPGDSLAVVSPSYSLYPFYAALNDLRFVEVPLSEAWQTDIDALVATGAKVILVASPNNPTGNTVPRADLERLIRDAPGIVIIDEAYIEFAAEGQSVLDLIGQHDNLIVMRTFSKAYALAGARLGWMAAHPETMALLGIVKPPFNINMLTECLGIRALAHDGFVHETVRVVHKERPRLTEALTERGFDVVPSDANFLLTFPPADGPDGPALAALLREAGIAARIFAAKPRLERSIRFTIGRAEDNDRLLAALDTLMTPTPEGNTA